MYILWPVTEQVFIADVGPDQSMVRIETVYLMEGEEAALEYC